MLAFIPQLSPAHAQDPKAKIDQLLDELSKLDPKALAAHLAKLQSEHKQFEDRKNKLLADHKKLADQAAALKKQADQAAASAAAVQRRIDVLNIILRPTPKAAQAPPKPKPAAPPKAAAVIPKPAPTKPAPKPVAARPAPKPAKKKMAAAAPKTPAATPPKAKAPPMKPAMAAKPTPKPLAKPAAKPAPKPAAKPAPPKPKPAKVAKPKPKPQAMVALINYADNVRPILVNKCGGCHNQDEVRGGLVVDQLDLLMMGGGSGEVIAPGDPEGSRLYRLVSHTETPHMPPKSPRIDDASLETIRKWIEQVALADAKSKPAAVASAAPQPAPAATPPPAPTDPDQIPIPAPRTLTLAPPTLRPTSVSALATSPVAPLSAVSGHMQILIHNTQSHELLAALPFPEGKAERLQFSADGKWLLAAGGLPGKTGLVVIFDVISGERIAETGQAYDSILAAAIDPYRELVAYGGSNKKVRVYDLFTNEPAYEIKAHHDWITAIAFSPDATLLATADRSGALFVWEAETGRQVHILRGHSGAINDLAFRSDSNVLASAGEDHTVRWWEMENGKRTRQFNAHNAAVLSLDYAADGRLCTGGADTLAKLWNPDGGAARSLDPKGDWVYEACFTSDDAGVLTGTWSGQIDLFEAQSGKRLWQFDTNPTAADSPPAEAAAALAAE